MALKRSVLRADSIQMGVLASPSETGVGEEGEPRSDWPRAIHRARAHPTQPRPVFQPLADLAHGTVVGYEALARFEARRTPPNHRPSSSSPPAGDDVLYDSPTSAWYSAINGWPAKSVTTAASAR
jgi:hypothetical protein